MTNPAQRPSIDAHLRRPWRERHEAPRRRTCAWPGCDSEGRYPAPRCRQQLRDYLWLCLAHVREYNQRWDYFAGMTGEQIDAHRRGDSTWHRPTWQFGVAPGWMGAHRWHDPFDLFGEERARARERPRPIGKAARMMAVLDLEVGFTLHELKQRYKTLVKKHHPDLHGGDKSAEERLKSIIEAYRYLLDNEFYA